MTSLPSTLQFLRQSPQDSWSRSMLCSSFLCARDMRTSMTDMQPIHPNLAFLLGQERGPQFPRLCKDSQTSKGQRGPLYSLLYPLSDRPLSLHLGTNNMNTCMAQTASTDPSPQSSRTRNGDVIMDTVTYKRVPGSYLSPLLCRYTREGAMH